MSSLKQPPGADFLSPVKSSPCTSFCMNLLQGDLTLSGLQGLNALYRGGDGFCGTIRDHQG